MFSKTLLASLTCCVLISGESFADAPAGEQISTHLQSFLSGPLTRKVKRYRQQQETLSPKKSDQIPASSEGAIRTAESPSRRTPE